MLRPLLLLAAIAPSCGASPWVRLASPLKGPLSTSRSRGDTSHAPCNCNGRRRRSPAFLVPRGGAIDDDSGNSDIAEESDGEQIYSVEEESDDIEDATDAEEDGDELHQSVLDRLALLSSTSRSLSATMVRYAALLMQMTRRACVAGARAIASGREAEGEDNERPVVHTILGRTVYVFGEMCGAALTPEEEGELDVEEEGRVDGGGRRRKKRRRHRKRKHGHRHHRRKHKQRTHVTRPTEVVCNGGAMDPSNNHAILQLAKQFDVDLPTDDTGRLSNKYDAILPSTHTTLAEALQKANGDARFLVCYISKGGRSDAIAIPNLLSSEFVKVANRRPLGKKQSGDTASYYVWVCTDAKESETATKRLKAKPPTSRSKGKGKKKGEAPILAIVYPASTVDPSGRLKVTPRTLAQHHCHPPPASPETLIAWTNAIRKRHLREFAKLQHDRKELQLLRERTEGYASSVQEDKAREEKEEREEQKKREEAESEKQRLEELEERRKELLEALPEEPEAGAGVMTIALRFADGKRDQRRFVAEDTSVNDVFNWIDAVHKMERERVELSTMNGARTFRYTDEEGGTLEEAGLGRMTALRVSEIAEEGERDEEGSEEGEEEDEYDEESDEEESEYEESDDE